MTTTKKIKWSGNRVVTLTGSETEVEWYGPGGVRCMARRDRGPWVLVEGPAKLVGREWRHFRDLRAVIRNG